MSDKLPSYSRPYVRTPNGIERRYRVVEYDGTEHTWTEAEWFGCVEGHRGTPPTANGRAVETYVQEYARHMQSCDMVALAPEPCDCGPIPMVCAPMNTPEGIQRCDLCAPQWMDDLDAALMLAHVVGGEVRFWQSDVELHAEFEEACSEGTADADDDLAEYGFEQRTYARPAREDDCVLSGTDPWVVLDERPVDWGHYIAFTEGQS